MKRILGIMLVVMILIGCCSCASGDGGGVFTPSIPETPAEEFSYTTKDGEITITGYKGTSREIGIPSKINDRPVTAIGEEAFSEYDLVKIDVPESVKVIDFQAFKECVCLEEVYLHDGLEDIDSCAFSACSALKSIIIPSTVKIIGWNAFKECTSLEKVVIKDGVETLEDNVFNGCKSLKEINLPNSVKNIEWSVFRDCYSLKEIEIPANAEIECQVDEYNGSCSLPTGSSSIMSCTKMVVEKDSPAHRALREAEKALGGNWELIYRVK